MKFLGGMDGGGTRTRLVIVDESGALVARGEAGCCSFVELGKQRAKEALRNLHESTWKNARLESRPLDALFMGMGSILADADRRTNCALAVEAGLVSEAAQVRAGNDAESALMGGLLGRPGILLIAGTGSACEGRNVSGQRWRAGGWGHLLEDRGSAHGLGRAALVAATRAVDGRGPETALTRVVCHALGMGDMKEIYVRLHHDGVARAEIAALARAVVDWAERGDAVAREILREGASGLGEMVLTVARKLALTDPELVMTGGLIEGALSYRRMFLDRIKERLPGARLTPAALPPVLGSVLLARSILGEAVAEKAFAERLKEHAGSGGTGRD